MNRSFFFEDQVYDWGHANEVKPVALLLLCPECYVAVGVFYSPLRCYAMLYVIVSFHGHTHYFYYYM